MAAAGRLTPFLVFLNPDAFPEPNWLSALLETAKQHPQAAAIGSTQFRDGASGVLDGDGDVLHATGFAYRSNYGKRRAVGPLAETFSPCGAAMLVRRDAFEAAGGFDSRYFCYFEDVDLGFRLRFAGHRVLQSPDAIVAHVGGGSAGAVSAFAEFHGARNRLVDVREMHARRSDVAAISGTSPDHRAGGDARPYPRTRTTRLARHPCWIRGAWSDLESAARTCKSRKASLSTSPAALAWSPDVFFTRRAVRRKIRG